MPQQLYDQFTSTYTQLQSQNGSGQQNGLLQSAQHQPGRLAHRPEERGHRGRRGPEDDPHLRQGERPADRRRPEDDRQGRRQRRWATSTSASSTSSTSIDPVGRRRRQHGRERQAASQAQVELRPEAAGRNARGAGLAHLRPRAQPGRRQQAADDPGAGQRPAADGERPAAAWDQPLGSSAARCGAGSGRGGALPESGGSTRRRAPRPPRRTSSASRRRRGGRAAAVRRPARSVGAPTGPKLPSMPEPTSHAAEAPAALGADSWPYLLSPLIPAAVIARSGQRLGDASSSSSRRSR